MSIDSIDQTFQTPILRGITAHARITAHAADSRYLRDVHSSLEHAGSGLKRFEILFMEMSIPASLSEAELPKGLQLACLSVKGTELVPLQQHTESRV